MLGLAYVLHDFYLEDVRMQEEYEQSIERSMK